jgi:hypothetical protein
MLLLAVMSLYCDVAATDTLLFLRPMGDDWPDDASEGQKLLTLLGLVS